MYIEDGWWSTIEMEMIIYLIETEMIIYLNETEMIYHWDGDDVLPRFVPISIIVHSDAQWTATVCRVKGDAIIQITRSIGDVADECRKNG